jgi:hypothetical protein
VLKAEGRETRGQGNAAATITATITPDGDGSAVNVVTDLTVSGKVAQFGRGVLGDVSTRLMKQFVDCLEKDLAVSMEPSIPASRETVSAPAATAQPVDLVATAGAPVAKRAAPLVAVIFLSYWLLRRRRRNKKK